jgi:hypothetical protein
MVREGFADRTEDTTEFSVDRRHPRVLGAKKPAGARVRNAAGENPGRIRDLAIDLATGQVAYALMRLFRLAGSWKSAAGFSPSHGVRCGLTKPATNSYSTRIAGRSKPLRSAGLTSVRRQPPDEPRHGIRKGHRLSRRRKMNRPGGGPAVEAAGAARVR